MLHKALATGDLTAEVLEVTIICNAQDDENFTVKISHIAPLVHLLIVAAAQLNIDLTRPARVIPFASPEARREAETGYAEALRQLREKVVALMSIVAACAVWC